MMETLLCPEQGLSFAHDSSLLIFVMSFSFFENKVSSADIFEEIPIKIQNPLLLHALLYELRDQKNLSNNLDRLDLSSAAILKKNLRRLEETIDEYVSEQSSYLFHQKKVARAVQDRENFVQQRVCV
jgi:hypothetical protein